jgi:hypothetical protein
MPAKTSLHSPGPPWGFFPPHGHRGDSIKKLWLLPILVFTCFLTFGALCRRHFGYAGRTTFGSDIHRGVKALDCVSARGRPYRCRQVRSDCGKAERKRKRDALPWISARRRLTLWKALLNRRNGMCGQLLSRSWHRNAKSKRGKSWAVTRVAR